MLNYATAQPTSLQCGSKAGPLRHPGSDEVPVAVTRCNTPPHTSAVFQVDDRVLVTVTSSNTPPITSAVLCYILTMIR
jgi:hypothetical protein